MHQEVRNCILLYNNNYSGFKMFHNINFLQQKKNFKIRIPNSTYLYIICPLFIGGFSPNNLWKTNPQVQVVVFLAGEWPHFSTTQKGCILDMFFWCLEIIASKPMHQLLNKCACKDICIFKVAKYTIIPSQNATLFEDPYFQPPLTALYLCLASLNYILSPDKVTTFFSKLLGPSVCG